MNAQVVNVLMIVVIIGVFYFLMIRPQQKRQKERQNLMKSMGVGDRVISIGGIHGVITRLDDATITIRVDESHELTFEKTAINRVVERAMQ
nr:preprotein translocase subunit YajC [Bacilli bacterium]